MKVYLDYDDTKRPPLISMFIKGCPHYRQDDATLMVLRESINEAALEQILIPIDWPIDLWVAFVDPTTPDVVNCLSALYRAMDGKALWGRSLLTDDGLVSKVTAMKFYPSERGRAENRVP